MPPKATLPRKPVPWYRNRRVVAFAGSLTGLVVFSWISVVVVFYSSRLDESRPQLKSVTTPLDVSRFMASFHPMFVASEEVESYYWPKEEEASMLLHFSNLRSLPFVISAHAISDWHMLYKWASGISWIVDNNHKYDFEAQKSGIFWSHFPSKVLAHRVPMSAMEESETHYMTLEDFYSGEYEESEGDGEVYKYKRFEGIVRRPFDSLQEFPNSPKEDLFETELKNLEISMILQSHSARQQPYLSLSGQLFMQASGETDWLLAPPEEAGKMALNSFFHPFALQAQLDLHAKLNSSYLASMDLEETYWGGEERSDVHVQYIRLFPGQLLYVPPFWVAHNLASSTSVYLKALLDFGIEKRLEAVGTAKLKEIEKIIETTQSPPDQALTLKVQVLLHLLHDIHPKLWLAPLLKSYDALYSNFVLTKADLSHKMIISACTSQNIETLPEVIRKHTEEVSNQVLEVMEDKQWKSPSQRSIVSTITADALMIALLDDPRLIHDFLHECQHHWDEEFIK